MLHLSGRLLKSAGYTKKVLHIWSYNHWSYDPYHIQYVYIVYTVTVLPITCTSLLMIPNWIFFQLKTMYPPQSDTNGHTKAWYH